MPMDRTVLMFRTLSDRPGEGADGEDAASNYGEDHQGSERKRGVSGECSEVGRPT